MSDERRRELQRRAFAPGGGLTPEEAEELRMLSQPAAAESDPSTSSGAQDGWVAEPVEASPSPEPLDPSTSSGAQDGRVAEPVEASSPSAPEPASAASAPRPRRPRWLVPLVLLVALIVGLGVGWLVSPHPSRAQPPAMNAAQQKVEAELAAKGRFDADSLAFAGEKHGASVWTAKRGREECVVMLLDGQRKTECADPKTGTYGEGMIGVQLETRGDGDLHSTVTAVLMTDISGRRIVMLTKLNMTTDDNGWQGQYSKTELDIVHVLEKAGFKGSELNLAGYDGDIPIWTSWNQPICVAVVDPDTQQVIKNCMDPVDGDSVQIQFRDAIYSIRWSQSHGASLSVIRDPKAVSRASCDAATGQCTSIDDTTGDIG